MSRLASELERLFLTPGASTSPGPGPVRVLVLEVSRPAAWQPLGDVWKGVQADLGLPAPAIAVNGVDGLQLWFSLAEAVDASQGRALLEGLRQRYMADVPLNRVVMQIGPLPVPMPRAVEAQGPWSAFVAADLAPLFEESPWLDMPPNEDGQAQLLVRTASIQPAALKSALQRLRGQPEAADEDPAVDPQPDTRKPAHLAATQFLLGVMEDETAPLALRVEAAKALLPYPMAR